MDWFWFLTSMENSLTKKEKFCFSTRPSTAFNLRHLKRILCFAGFCKNDVSNSHTVTLELEYSMGMGCTEKQLPHYLACCFILALHIAAASSLFLCLSRRFNIFRRCVSCVWLAGCCGHCNILARQTERKHTQHNSNTQFFWCSEWFSYTSVYTPIYVFRLVTFMSCLW